MRNELLKIHFVTASREDFIMLDTIEGIYDGNLHELVIYYLYVYANYHLIEYETYVLNKYDYEHSNFISNRLFYISEYERKELYLQAYQQYQILEKELLNTNNRKQLVYVYMYMTGVLVHIDCEQMDQYKDRFLEILTMYEFTQQQLYSIYMYLGSLYILRDEYEFSMNCMTKALKELDKLYYRSYIYLYYCFDKLHRGIPQFTYEIDMSLGDKIDSVLYVYFKNKSSRANKENRDYLIKVISPLLERNDKIYVKLIEDELKSLCRKMKSYQKLYEFQEKIRKK